MNEKSNILGYIITLSPLVISQLLIPPLSYFFGERINFPLLYDLYSLFTPKQFFSYKYLQSLMFDYNTFHFNNNNSNNNNSSSSISNTISNDRIFTIFSYLFVHADYIHLFNNIQSLCLVSLPVYQTFGSIGLYTIFFGSGIAAIAPSSLRQSQLTNQPFPKNLWKSLVTAVFPPRCCGSSGAVFGLLGGGYVIKIFDLVKYFSYINRKIRREKLNLRNNHNISSISYSKAFLRVFLKEFDFNYFLISIAQLGSIYFTVKSQLEFARNGGEGNIDNASHVQGFVCGAAMSTIFQGFKLFIES